MKTLKVSFEMSVDVDDDYQLDYLRSVCAWYIGQEIDTQPDFDMKIKGLSFVCRGVTNDKN